MRHYFGHYQKDDNFFNKADIWDENIINNKAFQKEKDDLKKSMEIIISLLIFWWMK